MGQTSVRPACQINGKHDSSGRISHRKPPAVPLGGVLTLVKQLPDRLRIGLLGIPDLSADSVQNLLGVVLQVNEVFHSEIFRTATDAAKPDVVEGESRLHRRAKSMAFVVPCQVYEAR